MIFLLLAILYLVVLATFVVGLRRGLDRSRGVHENVEKPLVTVLVCARNEEQNIDRCIASLEQLHYPAERLQILVVDDHSTDATARHLSEWCRRLPHLQVLSLTSPHEGGKVNALTVGMDAAIGEFVCITDADCQVPPSWIEEYLKWYDAATGLVSSVTITNSSHPTAVCQSIEMMQLLGMSMAGINMGVAVSIIGNNLSIRRAAYEDIGGYRAIPFSVTEDVALFQAMWQSRWDVRFKASDRLLVTTNPPGSLSAWWRQKQRWVIGAKSLGFIGWFILILGYVGMIAAFGALWTQTLPMIVAVIGIKIIGDLMIIGPMAMSLKRIRLILYVPIYQFYLLFFLVCVPLQYAQRTVVWKDRDYHT
ncbi:MAG: glycosyltransferase [Bacteroidetes bacterium]|nr:glycosyltransferase [Bacteroidota bacterium]